MGGRKAHPQLGGEGGSRIGSRPHRGKLGEVSWGDGGGRKMDFQKFLKGGGPPQKKRPKST